MKLNKAKQIKRRKMYYVYQFEVYPTKQQVVYFEKTLGLLRMYHNFNVENFIYGGAKNQSEFKLPCVNEVFRKKRPEALDWLKAVDSYPFAAEWGFENKSYSKWFKDEKKRKWQEEQDIKKGKKKKEEIIERINGINKGDPKFKSKKTQTKSITFQAPCKIQFKDGGLFLTRKLGILKGSFGSYYVREDIKRATLKQTKSGRYFLSLMVERKSKKRNHNGKAVGIDLGYDDDNFLVFSDGTRIKCPYFLRSYGRKIARIEKQMTRRRKFTEDEKCAPFEEQSNNYKKSLKKYQKLHEYVAWRREWWLHQLTNDIAKEYEYVFMEDINLQHMGKRWKHGRKVADQGAGMLRQMLAYKCGCFKMVNKNDTTQTCCVCEMKAKVELGVKHWKCCKCGAEHERDINAALNILKRGLNSVYLGDLGNLSLWSVWPYGCKSAMKQEILA